MTGKEEDENIVLIDKLRPGLAGKDPRQKFSIFFIVALAAIFLAGLLIGSNWGLGIEKQQPLIVHICLTIACILCMAIGGIASVSLMKTLNRLLSSNSKEESQQAERAAQHKQAASNLQAQQPGTKRRKTS